MVSTIFPSIYVISLCSRKSHKAMWYQITEAYLCLLLSLYKVYCNTHTHKHCTCIQLYLIGMLSASVYHLFSLRTPWGGYHATSRRWKSPSMWRAATSRWLDDGVLQRNPWVKWQIIDKSLGKIMENPTQTRWKKCATRIDQDGINDFSQYLCNIIAWFSLFQDLLGIAIYLYTYTYHRIRMIDLWISQIYGTLRNRYQSSG